MSDSPSYLAIDLGAESGRALLARFDGERIALDEIHRFPNEPVPLPDGLHWDAPRLFRAILHALAIAAGRGTAVQSIGVDTWGVDFGLLDRDGALLGLPFHYRDGRAAGMVERALGRVPGPDWWYRRTGCQTIPFNTAYQLLAAEHSPPIEAAETMLLLPDLMAYWLSGEVSAEQTIASTTQLYDPVAQMWAADVVASLRIPDRLFRPVRPPGAVIGPLRPNLAAECGLPADVAVARIAGHDTASAFAAVTSGPASLVISSGTWSLIGIETTAPILTPAAMAANFTNEAGVAGTIRFLRNAAGLWLIQECRRAWARVGQDHSYADLTRLAMGAPPFGPLVDPDDVGFLAPGDMPARIRAACLGTGQTPPTDPGATVRCALESLALRYRAILAQVERIAARPIERVHIVGGGARNALHCQLTADATGLPVLAGPMESTALGNALVQALALGDLADLDELRAAVDRSFTPTAYDPDPTARARWDEAGERFRRITSGPGATAG